MSLNRETTIDNTQFSIDVFKGSVVNKICHSVNEESLVMSSSVYIDYLIILYSTFHIHDPQNYFKSWLKGLEA